MDTNIKYNVFPAKELTEEQMKKWSSIQLHSDSFASPYFRPEFTQAVAEVRNDVFVCVLEEAGEIRGFFPFHYGRGKIARPIGLALSDYHGVIAELGAKWTVEKLMECCGIDRWIFDHLPISQKQFSSYHMKVTKSPIIDISQGMKVYEASRDKSARKQLKEIKRKAKKLENQIGPVSFTLKSSSEKILQQLINWKSEQCRKTGTVDYFALKWCTEFIKKIHKTRKDNFGGILSCLYAGNILAAVHFGMYSKSVWHSWFPAYNNSLEEYSPGSILLLEIIKSAAENGIQYIDLGKGLSLYKKRVMTGDISIAEGVVELPSLRNRIRHIRNVVEKYGEKSFLSPILRIPGRIIKKREREKRYE